MTKSKSLLQHVSEGIRGWPEEGRVKFLRELAAAMIAVHRGSRKKSDALLARLGHALAEHKDEE